MESIIEHYGDAFLTGLTAFIWLGIIFPLINSGWFQNIVIKFMSSITG